MEGARFEPPFFDDLSREGQGSALDGPVRTKVNCEPKALSLGGCEEDPARNCGSLQNKRIDNARQYFASQPGDLFIPLCLSEIADRRDHYKPKRRANETRRHGVELEISCLTCRPRI